MKLKRVLIKKYKCLRNFEIIFRDTDDRVLTEKNRMPIQFIVGWNGSGKSSFLEALGLIFTRIMQNELPGFYFELEYQIGKGNTSVAIKPDVEKSEEKFMVVVGSGEGSTGERIKSFEKFLPRRIISYSSGVNTNMDYLMTDAIKEELAMQIHNLTLQRDKELEIEQLWKNYHKIDDEQRILHVTPETSKMILPALFAVAPKIGSQQSRMYMELRSGLIQKVIKEFQPVLISLVIDEEKFKAVSAQRGADVYYTYLKKVIATEKSNTGTIYDWQSQRTAFDRVEGSEEEYVQNETICIYHLDKEEQIYHERLTDLFEQEPMNFLKTLLRAHRDGVLKDIHFLFRCKDSEILMDMDAFSDGELMWIARMGLVLMSYTQSASDTLYLFDEPDVHFNDGWNIDFVATLQNIAAGSEWHETHELLAATHSSLILTDALPDQINLLEYTAEYGTRAAEHYISGFGAGRDNINKKLFRSTPVGVFAMSVINERIRKAEKPEELEELLDCVGPGYQRFRIFERYHELMQKAQDR